MWASVISRGISIAIIAVNYVLRYVIIILIKFVRYDTFSAELAAITNGIFYTQFINTGFLLLLVNANLSEHPKLPLSSWLQGPFYDYMPAWYIDVGYKLVYAMIINAFMPYAGIVSCFMAPAIKRLLDSKFTWNMYKTKCKSMQQYKDIWSGKAYIIHYKYSSVLNVVFVSMMYGIAMPILFPLGAINFLN